MPSRSYTLGRVASMAAIFLLGAVAIFIILRGGGQGPYVIHARFVDAGQLVKGNVVQIGGRRIGTVSALRLTADNQADVVLSITDDRWRPLHRGTIASIRTIGLAGVANRFVDLAPGPRSAPAIPNNGVLTTAETRPIVDLDELLDALDPPTRLQLQRIIRNGPKVFGGVTEQANQAFAYLNPALAQTDHLAQEIVREEPALEYLLQSSATTVTTLARRRADLEAGLVNGTVALRAIASRRAALGDSIARAPAVLAQARGTLGRLRSTLVAVRPALREAQPVAPPLAHLLADLVPTVQHLRPVVAQLRSVLPSLDQALRGLPHLAHVAVPAVRVTSHTLNDLMPIVRGLRPYAPDVINGLFAGFGGSTAGYYDANGHYARIAPELRLGSGGLTGLLGPLVDSLPIVQALQPLVGNLTRYDTGLTARCPGGAVEPAPDASNPWVTKPWRKNDYLCDPSQDLK